MDLNKLTEENCGLKRSLTANRFNDLCRMCGGDPCTTGCAHYNLGKCHGYISASRSGSETSVTNVEIAEDLGVSKRAVSKMRKEGTLPLKWRK